MKVIDMEPVNTETLPAKRALTTSDYLKAGAVLLGTGAAYGLAKATGAWSWLWSAFEPETASTQALQTQQDSVVTKIDTVTPIISDLPSSTSVVAMDSLGLAEVLQAKEEEEITELGLESDTNSFYKRQLTWLPLSDQFQVNTIAGGSNAYPDPKITVLPTNDFVITWQFYNGQSRFFTKCFAMDGSPKWSTMHNDARSHDIETSVDGNFIIVYKQGIVLYSQIYNVTGGSQNLPSLVESASNAQDASIATLPTSDFVVVWDTNTQVYARRYNSTGAPQEMKFQVNTITTSTNSGANIAALPTGDFVIVWTHDSGAGSVSVQAKRFNAIGTTQSEFRADSGRGENPDIAALSTGDFVVVWYNRLDYNIHARRFDSFDTPQGPEFLITTYASGSPRSENPNIATLPTGGFVVVFSHVSGGKDIYARRFDNMGLPQGDEFQINTHNGLNVGRLHIGALSSGDFIVAWGGDAIQGGVNQYDVYARLIRGNSLPILEKNQLIIQDAEILPINTDFLNATDFDIDANIPDLLFIISGTSYGQFEYINNTGMATLQFSQLDIASNQIQFVHDGSNQPPSYSVSVSDGELTTDPELVTVFFNYRPIITNHTLSLIDGETPIIDTSMLATTDGGIVEGSLTFTASLVQEGQFEFISDSGVSITTFTQSQVQAQTIRFVHDGNGIAPSYSISVSDGTLSSPVQSATIDFSLLDILVNNPIAINDGETLLISTSTISTTDTMTSSNELTFTVSDVQNAWFELITNPGVAITQFTLAQIEVNQLRFVHVGNNLAPSYSIQLSNGRATTPLDASNINFNRRPELITNQLTLNEDDTIQITTAILDATDDQSTSTLTFAPVNLQGGHFALSGSTSTPISQFTGSQIQAGDVVFVHTGGATAPSYQITASDGVITSLPATASITFNPRPILAYNVLYINDQTTVTNLTSTMLLATDNQPDNELTFAASGIQNGHFELTTASGVPVTQFTQAQVKAGLIQFIRDSVQSTPGYDISVSDGVLSTAPSPTTVTYNTRPSISANTLLLDDAATVTLTTAMLQVDDDGTETALTLTVSNVQQGHFQHVSAAGIPIVQFTQAQVTAGDIQFVHDGSNLAPSYQVSASDGELSTVLETAQIIFNPRPVITVNTLTIDDGASVLLSMNTLNTDDNQGASALTYTVSNVQHGQFEFTGVSGTPITEFTQLQVNLNQVRFVHNGSNLAPSYTISVSDGALSSALVAPVVSFNQRPQISSNTLSIDAGATVILSASLLATTDDQIASALIYTVSGVQRGQFEQVSDLGVAIVQFTQAQVDLSAIQFVHDGSNQPPSYMISVSDGTLSTAPAAAIITFNPRPSISLNALSLVDGDSITLTLGMLRALDDASDDTLTFSVTDVQHGRFEFSNAVGIPITQFTQAQVAAGEVRFVHDGSNIAPSYTVSVSDGTLSSASSTATILFNQSPVLTANQLMLNDGETILLTSAMLSVSDDQSPAAITYTLSDITQGQFELTNNPGVAITQFTQQQVNDGYVQFVHNGSGLTPGYRITASDGTQSTATQSGVVQFNTRPILSVNQLSFREEDLVVGITADHLLAIDDDLDTDLTFSILSPQGGDFVKTSATTVPITQFTQAEVAAGSIAFLRTSTTVTPSYSVSVSDGQLSSPAQTATVSINRRPTFIANQLMINEGGTTLISPSLLAVDDDADPSALEFKASFVTHGHFAVVRDPEKAITTFTAEQLNNEQILFIHDGSDQAPSYRISVSDGEFTTPPETATIVFNRLPVLKNNQLVIDEGKPVTLTTDMLSAEDDAPDEKIVFTILDLEHGQFTRVSAPTVAITEFTQAEIKAGDIQFVPDGSGLAPTYLVSVSDGLSSSSTPTAAVVDFTPPEKPAELPYAEIFGPLGGAAMTVLATMWYKRRQEEKAQKQEPIAFDLYQRLNLSLHYISPTMRGDDTVRTAFVSGTKQLVAKLKQNGILLEEWRKGGAGVRGQYQQVLALLSTAMQEEKVLEMGPATILFGVPWCCCLASREMVVNQLENETVQNALVAQILANRVNVSRVVGQVKQGSLRIQAEESSHDNTPIEDQDRSALIEEPVDRSSISSTLFKIPSASSAEQQPGSTLIEMTQQSKRAKQGILPSL